MKIICVDNFDRDYKDDFLVAENLNHVYAREITKFLNDRYSGDNSDSFYRVVEDDYKLYKFEV